MYKWRPCPRLLSVQVQGMNPCYNECQLMLIRSTDGGNSLTYPPTLVLVAPPGRLYDLSERRRASLIDGEAAEVHDGRKGNSGVVGSGGGILRLRHNGLRGRATDMAVLKSSIYLAAQ